MGPDKFFRRIGGSRGRVRVKVKRGPAGPELCDDRYFMIGNKLIPDRPLTVPAALSLFAVAFAESYEEKQVPFQHTVEADYSNAQLVDRKVALIPWSNRPRLTPQMIADMAVELHDKIVVPVKGEVVGPSDLECTVAESALAMHDRDVYTCWWDDEACIPDFQRGHIHEVGSDTVAREAARGCPACKAIIHRQKQQAYLGLGSRSS